MSDYKTLISLGLSPDENNLDAIREAYEDKVFELANFFMRRSFVPRLAQAKIQRLEDLKSVRELLNPKPEREERGQNSNIQFNAGQDSLAKLVQSYQKAEAGLKQHLAAALDYQEAVRLYANWIGIFEAYAASFVKFYEASPDAIPADNLVKITDQVDATALIAEIKDPKSAGSTVHREYSRLKNFVD